MGATPSSKKGHMTLANRKKSLSDGNLCESLRRFQDSLKRVAVRDTIAARDIESPSVAGYLDRKVTGDHWNSCWCVLKDSSLYRYSSAVDEVTEDILLLHGYEVLRCPEIHGRDFAFELLHPDNPSELLAASNADELSEWMTKLKQATQHVSIEGLDLEPGAGGRQFSDGGCLKTPDTSKAKHCSKQQLLQEVLQEKMRLEQSQRRKRKERSKLGDVFHNDDHSPLGSAASTPELSPDIVSLTSQTSCASIRVSGQSSQTHEQSLREISHLRQRKASTQLKVETLQRQLTITSKQKPKRFKLGLGGNKNTSASKEANQTGNVQIQKQLQALQSELDTISHTLEQKKKMALGDLGAVMDVKQNKKKGSNNNTPTEELPSNSRSSNGGTSLLLKDTKRNSLEGCSSVTNGNGSGIHSNKQEVCRTSSADPRLMNATVVRHSWDVNKDKTKEKSTKERSNSCQPITRERAYTTPDDLNPPRPRQGSTSSQSEIDPAVMAQISAFEELLQERLHIQ